MIKEKFDHCVEKFFEYYMIVIFICLCSEPANTITEWLFSLMLIALPEVLAYFYLQYATNK